MPLFNDVDLAIAKDIFESNTPQTVKWNGLLLARFARLYAGVENIKELSTIMQASKHVETYAGLVKFLYEDNRLSDDIKRALQKAILEYTARGKRVSKQKTNIGSIIIKALQRILPQIHLMRLGLSG